MSLQFGNLKSRLNRLAAKFEYLYYMTHDWVWPIRIEYHCLDFEPNPAAEHLLQTIYLESMKQNKCTDMIVNDTLQRCVAFNNINQFSFDANRHKT